MLKNIDVSKILDNSKDRFIIGDIDTCKNHIEKLEDQYGMTELILRIYIPGLSQDYLLNELKIVAEEIISF